MWMCTWLRINCDCSAGSNFEWSISLCFSIAPAFFRANVWCGALLTQRKVRLRWGISGFNFWVEIEFRAERWTNHSRFKVKRKKSAPSTWCWVGCSCCTHSHFSLFLRAARTVSVNQKSCSTLWWLERLYGSHLLRGTRLLPNFRCASQVLYVHNPHISSSFALIAFHSPDLDSNVCVSGFVASFQRTRSVCAGSIPFAIIRCLCILCVFDCTSWSCKASTVCTSAHVACALIHVPKITITL